jgi:hypothetical protein
VCRKAIQLIEDDGDFSENEGANVVIMFVRKSAYATAFIAARDKKRRTAFIHRMLATPEDDDQ